MLINDEFVYLPIPKNGSTSIIYSILQWGIPVDFGSSYLNKIMQEQIYNVNFEHFHNTHSYYKNLFSDKKIVAIRRDSADRFISALKYLIYRCKIENIKLKYDFENMNELDIIYIFSNLFYDLENIKIPNQLDMDEVLDFVNNVKIVIKKHISNDVNFNRMYLDNFRSQYFWGLNDCDIIIDIKDIDIFENMIKNIKPNFNLVNINVTKDVTLQIKKTDNIIQFVKDSIDSKYLI